MECSKEFATLAGENISERGAFSAAEGFTYLQNLLSPLQYLQLLQETF